MSKEYDTLAEAANDDAVIEIIDRTTLKVQPYANSTFFNGLANGSITLGNVCMTNYQKYLRVNVEE